MFPELRSKDNAVGHCGSLGGHIVVPKTEKHNLDVVDIAEQYYKVPLKLFRSSIN